MSEHVMKRFLSYVEIMTKITSIFAFLMALAYLFYIGQPLNLELTGIFFLSMFLFDLTTTAINNYIDTKTNSQDLQFSRGTALGIIYVLFLLSAGLGLYLAFRTDLVVLGVGGLCFLCGVLYTYGPVSISRQPLGEILSGVFYGLVIPFILFYINRPQGAYLTYSLSRDALEVTLRFRSLAALALLAAAPTCATANIMLANNICDVEKDVEVMRHTLPYYLGKKALDLYAWIYYVIYLAGAAMVALRVLPWPYLLFILTLIPVQKNIREFRKKQEKETTFVLSIRNFIVIMGADVVLIFLCGLLRRLL